MKTRRAFLRVGVPAIFIFKSLNYKINLIVRLAPMVLFLFVASLNAAAIKGLVKNGFDQTPLANANIVLRGTDMGAVSKDDGSFVLSTVPEGEVVLEISYVGFESTKLTVQVSESETAELSVFLRPITISTDDIMVTSTRYERSIRDVALPLSVVKRQTIERLMPRDASEAVALEPGLSVTRDGVWGTHVTIRGLSRNNVVTMIDGNRIDTANDLAAGLSMVDPNDIERVEIIKGAGSSLYGTGAIGGVVNVLTKDGEYRDDFYMDANLTGGYSSANRSGQGFFTLRGGAAKWYVKLSGMNRNAEDMNTPNGVLENSRFSDSNLAARFGFRPTLNHEFKINWQRYRGTDIGLPGGNTLFPSQAEVRYPKENRDLFTVEYSGRNITSNLTKISAKYVMQDILRDVENIPHMVKDVPGTPPKRMNVLQILPNATHVMNGAQLQSDWLLGRQHVILGLDAWQKELDSRRERIIRVDVLTPTGDVAKSINQIVGERPIPLSTYRSTGLYLQDEIPYLNDRLLLTLGGRYDLIQVDNEKTYQPDYLVVEGVRDNQPAGQVVLWDAQTAQDHSWSGNLGLLFKTTKNSDVTLTLARSFRSPYLEERYQYIDLGSLVKVGDPNLKPEQGAFADVGLRYWGDRFTLAGNLFFNQIKNMVTETPGVYDERNALLKTNIGSAELYGLDLGLTIRLYKSISFFGNAAYVYGTDTYLDEPLPLVPPLNGRVGLRGTMSRFLEFECAARLVGRQNRVAEWEMDTSGYSLFDFYLNSRSFNLGRMNSQVFLGIENIFDRAYRDHLSTNRGSIVVEPGRNISIRWRLGI